MRTRWTVLVAALGERLDKGRTFGNFEALSDAQKLAMRITRGLADGYTATPIPFYQLARSGNAALEHLPAHMRAGK